MTNKPNLKFAAKDYQAALIEAIDSAKRRILLETMVFNAQAEMADIMTVATKAAQRGVEVILLYDKYTYFDTALSKGPGIAIKLAIKLKQLRQAGINTQSTGSLELNPFAGRNHVKAVVIDDQVFAGGGINLANGSFASQDFMCDFTNKQMANELYQQLPRLAHERMNDKIIYQDDINQLLLDGGAKGQSLIYETVCDLASQAERVWYVSKLAPDGRLADILQNKPTEYWYNTTKTAGLADSMAIYIDKKRNYTHNLYQLSDNLHAKFCVFVMPGGSKQVITGSHNFNSRGVKFGTQEIALRSKDQQLAEELIDFANTLG